MCQLKNVINRKAISADPTTNVKAAEDFLLILVHSHVLAAIRLLYSLDPTNSVAYLAKSVVVTHLSLPHPDAKTKSSSTPDGVHAYVCIPGIVSGSPLAWVP